MEYAEDGDVDPRGCACDWDRSVKENFPIIKGRRQSDCVRMDRGNDIGSRGKVLSAANSCDGESAKEQNDAAKRSSPELHSHKSTTENIHCHL